MLADTNSPLDCCAIDPVHVVLQFQDHWLQPHKSEVIRDQLVWDKAIFPQQLAHQFERRPLVPPGLDQNVEHFALGIHGAPEVD